jgi:hypothetical protein
MTAGPKGLGALFDAHTQAEFKTLDIEATMATMNEAPHVTHVHHDWGLGTRRAPALYEIGSLGIGRGYGDCADLAHRRRDPIRRRGDGQLHA